jgi:hypothetical protein
MFKGEHKSARHERARMCYAPAAQSSPRAARALIRSAVRHAMAWIVSDGFIPPTVGNTEPASVSRLANLRQSCNMRLDLFLV